MSKCQHVDICVDFFWTRVDFFGTRVDFSGTRVDFFVDVVGPVTVARAGKAHMHAEAPPRRQNKSTKSAPARKKSAADKKKSAKGGTIRITCAGPKASYLPRED